MDKKFINWFFLLGATIILAGTFFYVWNRMIQSSKDNQQTSMWITNTISVVWEWKTFVVPDTLVINISVSELAKTTQEAQTQANAKIAKIKEILKTLEIAKENLKTINVNVYPEYDRSNNQRTLLGYRSQQSLSIEVAWENFATKGWDVIDKIAAIGWVNVDNTYFNLKDKNKAMGDAREKALNDAKTKAEQLAKFSWMTLGKPVMITNNEINYNPTPMYAMAESAKWAWDTTMNTADLSPGQTEVTVTVNVSYEIK